MTSEARHNNDMNSGPAAGEIDHVTAAQMRGQNPLEGPAAAGAPRAEPGTAMSAAARVPRQNTQAGSSPGLATLRPRYTVRRVLCGIWWAIGTVLCATSALISLSGGHFLQFLGATAIAALVGWYDYRVWTFKAKWLMFLIIF